VTNTPTTPGIAPARLDQATLQCKFSDHEPPLDPHEASVAADRCYFCLDAPCIAACPTEIDIPLFIRQIQAGQPEGAARTILDQNILGGMCARVCPTETLCEGACVREFAESKPVEIGRLQRYATDSIMARDGHPYQRAAPTGKRVAVVGAGPAGLACAHRLAMRGHDVVLMEARDRIGGLNEYGIAAYKRPAISRRPKSRGFSGSAASRRARAFGLARMSRSRICGANTMRCFSAWALAGSTRSVSRARRAMARAMPWISSPSCVRPMT